MSPEDPAETAIVDVLGCLLQALVGTVLRAGLHDPTILRRGLDDLAALPSTVRDGLLNVDILAGLAGPYRQQGMPVVRRRDDHGIHVLALQDPSRIGV